MNYYNEFDPKAAAWLRELMANGHIPKGEIDTRSITEVQPSDLSGFRQCHFFAGIGGWSLALQLAEWPEDEPVWTGSCPCQPFSAAGKQLGSADERHLWPQFHRLISVCRPPVVFGEQVASKAGRDWLAGVRTDLERVGYAVGASDLCAPCSGAPHIRQRLYWVADAKHSERRTVDVARQDGCDRQDSRREEAHGKSGACGEICGLADADRRCEGLEPGGSGSICARSQGNAPLGPWRGGAIGRLEYASRVGRQQRWPESGGRSAVGGCGFVGLGHPDESGPQGRHERGYSANKLSAWTPSVALACTDGKSRRTEPGIFPLAHGFSESLARVLSRYEVVWSEIVQYAKSHETNADEVLRMVRESIHAGSGWKEQPTGVCFQFHAPSLLLDLLLGAEAARNGTPDKWRGKKEGAKIVGRAVRVLRSDSGALCSSCGRASREQQPGQSSEAMHVLPLILARHVEAYREETLAAYAALNRVAMLRGYGNAIVPQVAAEFIQAFQEADAGTGSGPVIEVDF